MKRATGSLMALSDELNDAIAQLERQAQQYQEQVELKREAKAVSEVAQKEQRRRS